ncbi:MAG: hypothetical protein V7739_17400 [Motiliproteus sp.]
MAHSKAEEVNIQMKYPLLLLFTVVALTAGCSKGEDTATPDQSGKEHLLKSQAAALERAKEIEQVLQRGAENRQQAIEDQSK